MHTAKSAFKIAQNFLTFPWKPLHMVLKFLQMQHCTTCGKMSCHFIFTLSFVTSFQTNALKLQY